MTKKFEVIFDGLAGIGMYTDTPPSGSALGRVVGVWETMPIDTFPTGSVLGHDPMSYVVTLTPYFDSEELSVEGAESNILRDAANEMKEEE